MKEKRTDSYIFHINTDIISFFEIKMEKTFLEIYL